MTEIEMAIAPTAVTELSIHEKPWEDVDLPPTDLPYDDGEPMESPWHAHTLPLLKASIIALRGGTMEDYFVGTNMFVYYSMQQVRNKDYKGPDAFVVNNVDGTRDRLSWIAWAEDGRYPDVIFELLSRSTEREDLGNKKHLYEQTFRTSEYFCIAPQVERLLGWRLESNHYVEIAPDERGWLWSHQLEAWVGPWRGTYLAHTYTWPRLYAADGSLILLSEEAAIQRAEAAEEQARAAEEQARAAEEQARSAEERATRAEERAARLATLLREHGIEPEQE